MDSNKWFSELTENQRARHIEPFRRQQLKRADAATRTSTSNSQETAIPTQASRQTIHNQPENDATLPPNKRGILPKFQESGLPPSTYAGSWDNAKKILDIPNSIVDALGDGQSKLVISLTGIQPHFVQIGKHGNFTCQCKAFYELNLYAHVIATAAHIGQTEQLLSHFRSKAGSANLMRCASRGASQQVGKKP